MQNKDDKARLTSADTFFVPGVYKSGKSEAGSFLDRVYSSVPTSILAGTKAKPAKKDAK